MISREDLKGIVILGFLDDPMLDEMMPFVNLKTYQIGEAVFKEGNKAARFFMLKKGKVLLEKRLSDTMTVSVDSIKAGYSFGWTAMLDEDAYTSDAVCAEVCEVLSIYRDDLLNLMNTNHVLGYIISQRLLRVIKKRLDHRTDQFVRAIQSHPDIRSLF